jgi:hypothetical protein
VRNNATLAPFVLFLLTAQALAACGGSSASSGGGGDSGNDATRSTDASGGGADGNSGGNDGGASNDGNGGTNGAEGGGMSDAAGSPDAPHDGNADAGKSGTDGGVSNQDGGIFTPGAPITATSQTWTWVDFPDAYCANGTATGLGVNLSTASSNVVIYLEGGGACWDDLTCLTVMSASNFTTGYSSSNFASESTDTTYLAEAGGFFDRTASSNPFKDFSWVYIPYCTGDVFGGNNVTSFGTTPAWFVGARNIIAYLDRIVPTFPSASSVYLMGSSAGGYGALLNWWRVQAAFGTIPVHMIDDSGTPVPPDVLMTSSAGPMGYQPEQETAWNIDSTLPPGCTGCTTRLDALFGYYATAFPNQRGALLSYTADTVLPSFYGISTSEFTTGLNEIVSTDIAPTTNLKSFEYGGSGHVLAFSPTLATNNVSVMQFVSAMVQNSGWVSEGP